MFGITERDLILSMGLFLLIRLDSISLDHSVPILLDHYKISPEEKEKMDAANKEKF